MNEDGEGKVYMTLSVYLFSYGFLGGVIGYTIIISITCFNQGLSHGYKYITINACNVFT